jgi:hypothetical protein
MDHGRNGSQKFFPAITGRPKLRMLLIVRVRFAAQSTASVLPLPESSAVGWAGTATQVTRAFEGACDDPVPHKANSLALSRENPSAPETFTVNEVALVGGSA